MFAKNKRSANDWRRKGKRMWQILRDSAAGGVAAFLLGFAFAKIGVPCPAPVAIPGVIGVAAVALGYWVGR